MDHSKKLTVSDKSIFKDIISLTYLFPRPTHSIPSSPRNFTAQNRIQEFLVCGKGLAKGYVSKKDFIRHLLNAYAHFWGGGGTFAGNAWVPAVLFLSCHQNLIYDYKCLIFVYRCYSLGCRSVFKA